MTATKESDNSEDSESVVLPKEFRPADAKEGLRPSAASHDPRSDPEESQGDHLMDEKALPEPKWIWPPRNSPMPMHVESKPPGMRLYINMDNDARWLVTYFEGYVVDKMNYERVAKGQKPIDEVSDRRKEKWYSNATKLASRHPVREVAEVIDWLFNVYFGFLPVVSEANTCPRDRKVTRLHQVEENYDRLRDAMECGAGPDPVGEPSGSKPSGVNYGEPFADPAEEARVTQLVELFTEFRTSINPAAGVHHTRTWRWAKSFRIMLAHRGVEFDDLVTVISALRDFPEMDRVRYHDAYDLQQRGDWEYLLSKAKLARLRAERQPPQRAAGIRSEAFADWDDWASGTPVLDSDDEIRSLDMTSRRRRPDEYYQQNLSD